MAGGTWNDQNKVRPGVYINYKSAPATLATMGERGTVAIARQLNWGEFGEFYTISKESDAEQLGYAYTADESQFIRQIFTGTNRTNGANKILVWRLEETNAKAATIQSGSLIMTAKYSGTRGNDLAVVCTADADNENKLVIQTLLDGSVVYTETIDGDTEAPAISLLSGSENPYVNFSGTGSVTTFASVSLTGGASGSLSSTAYSKFLTALESIPFDVLIYDGTDTVVKQTVANYVKRLSNNEGKRCQAVVSNYPKADSECVISVAEQKVELDGEPTLDAASLTWWVGGATAGAQIYQSLTYATHPNATGIDPIFDSSEQEEQINSGNFALIEQYGKIQCLTDINSFTTFQTEKGKAFRKNRVVRVVFQLCNDVYKLFSQYYVGAVHNDEEGRKALKAEILSLMNTYQGNRALQNVLVDDVTVEKGNDSDAVLIEINCQPVDSIEKIYINITIS